MCTLGERELFFAKCEVVSAAWLTIAPFLQQDPQERLQLLAQQQSDLLLQKLGARGASGGDDSGIAAGLEGHDITKRSLPFGSEDVVAHGGSMPAGSGSGILEPSYHGPGAAWEREEAYLQHSTAMPPSEEERDVLET